MALQDRRCRKAPSTSISKMKNESVRRTADVRKAKNTAGVGHVCFCVRASSGNACESQIQSTACFDISRTCLLTLCSWIKSTTIFPRLRDLSSVKATHFPSTEKEPYICRWLDLEPTSPHKWFPGRISRLHRLSANWNHPLNWFPDQDSADYLKSTNRSAQHLFFAVNFPPRVLFGRSSLGFTGHGTRRGF